MMRIGNKTVVVITGASGGVGRATARLLGERGAKVVLLARGREGLEGAKREVESRGGQALVVPTDVSNFEQVRAAADAAEHEFGPIDLWINNAMVSMYSPFLKMDAGRVSAHRRSYLPRECLRDKLRFATDDGARPGCDRTGRVGTGVSIDSASERLLREQACDSRVHRIDPQRTDSSEEQCAADRREYAGIEYHPICLDKK